MDDINLAHLKKSVPSVSVIIVNYNGAKYLEKCIQSLLKSYYPKEKFEIIVVDNNSTDGSMSFIKKYSSLKIFELPYNIGWVGGINFGFEHAKGNYIILLNNDAYVEDTWLLELVKSLQPDDVEISSSKIFLMDNSKIVGAAGCTNNILGQGWDVGMFSKDSNLFNSEYEITHPGGAACIIKRRAIEKYGFVLQPNLFMYQDDLDMGWRARLLGYKVMYAPKAVAYHKRGGSSANSPKSFFLFYRNMHNIFYQNLGTKNIGSILLLVDANIILTHLFKYVTTKNIVFLKNIFNIFRDIYKNGSELKKSRIKVQTNRKIGDKSIFELFSTKLLLPKSLAKYTFITNVVIKILNLYLRLWGIPVKEFDGAYYY